KDAKKKPPLIVGINASKEVVDLIKSGEILASGDYNGLVEGCLGTEIAIRTLRKQPVPKEVMAKTSVVDRNNYQAYEIPAERRPCPTLEVMAAKGAGLRPRSRRSSAFSGRRPRGRASRPLVKPVATLNRSSVHRRDRTPPRC